MIDELAALTANDCWELVVLETAWSWSLTDSFPFLALRHEPVKVRDESLLLVPCAGRGKKGTGRERGGVSGIHPLTHYSSSYFSISDFPDPSNHTTVPTLVMLVRMLMLFR